MKLQHRRTRLTKPPQTRAWLLCLFFAAGILAGFLARRTVKSDDLLALGSYFSDYAALTVQQPADIISVVWAYLRYPAAAFLLGFTAWGVMLLPLLCTAQGFFLSFSVHCFAASLGRGGVTLALAALGLRCLFVLPCLLVTASDSFQSAWCRAEKQKPEHRDQRRLMLCLFVLLTGTVAECALVPKLFALLLPRIA